MTKLVGVLCWFDESPSWLASCVTSLKGVVDHLVMVDGAYQLFPGANEQHLSSPDQVHVLTETATAAGIPFTLHRPGEPYMGNEVEKRNLSLDLARYACSSEDDWIFVIDADMVVTRCAPDLKETLDNDEFVCAQYAAVERLDVQDLTDRYGLDDHQDWTTDGLIYIRGFYRNLPNLHYEDAHWIVTAGEGSEKIYLWGEPKIHSPMASALDISDIFRVDHRNSRRERGRKMRAKEFYKRRDGLKIEQYVTYAMQGTDGELHVR